MISAATNSGTIPISKEPISNLALRLKLTIYLHIGTAARCFMAFASGTVSELQGRPRSWDLIASRFARLSDAVIWQSIEKNSSGKTDENIWAGGTAGASSAFAPA